MCADLDEIFKASDFVSIHVPYMDETHHLVDARRLTLMKKTAYIINTARGEIIDEAALAQALDVDKATIVADHEGPLVRAGLVMRTASGRIATPEAYALVRDEL